MPLRCCACRFLGLAPRPRGEARGKRCTDHQELYYTRFGIWLRARRTTDIEQPLQQALCCKACRVRNGFEPEN